MRRATAIKNERLGKREYITERDGAPPPRRDAYTTHVLYTALYFDSEGKARAMYRLKPVQLCIGAAGREAALNPLCKGLASQL